MSYIDVEILSTIALGQDPETILVHVRDSQHREQEPLLFDRKAWIKFIADVKEGKFDIT